MKVAKISRNEIVIEETPNILLDGRDGAIVKLLGCGLCGSDIVKFRQKLVPDGTVLGHEIVAEIVEINSKTEFQVGDIIVTSHHIPCKKCIYCKRGNVSMCEHFKNTNIQPGGFSEFIYVSEEHLKNVAFRKPTNLADIEASFYEPLACCIRAIRRCQLPADANALVIGIGSIGILMAQALNAYGFKVCGCDLAKSRVNMLKNFDIDAFIVNDLPNDYQFDCVFMTSGADSAIDTALKYVRKGGKILVFSSTPQNLGYANNDIYYKELTVLGSYSPDLDDLKTSLELLASKKVLVKDLSTVYEFNKINDAFQDKINNKIMKAYIKGVV